MYLQLHKELIKNHKDILIPTIKNLTKKEVNKYTELELMSADAIKDLLIGTIFLYLEEFKWKGQLKKHCKIPSNLYKTIRYIEYLYDSNAGHSGKGLTEFEAQRDAQVALIKFCYEQLLKNDGFSMGQLT